MNLLRRSTKIKIEAKTAYLLMQYVKELENKNKVLSIGAEELATRLEKRNARIKELEEALEAAKPKPISNQPLYLNETEEDIEYAFRNELIDKDQYEDMLKQLEFDNTQITFDLEAY